MIKIFHEAPKSIFRLVRDHTDGDYALVHLLERDPQYANLFFESKKLKREIILDNSIFELKKAFDADVFASWVKKLEPEYYIVPDVLEDSCATVRQFEQFMLKYSDELPGKCIGVVQGKSYDEVKRCYEALHTLGAAKIAFSFDLTYWLKTFNYVESEALAYMYGRQSMLRSMVDESFIDTTKPHHLLGCFLPQEFRYYVRNRWTESWIDSVDTSNPIVHGIYDVCYHPIKGLTGKIPIPMNDLIERELSDNQKQTCVQNMKFFRRFCGR